MPQPNVPRPSIWPFAIVSILGDAALLYLASWIARHSPGPLAGWHLGCLVLCVLAGAALGMTPFWAAYRAGVRLAESQMLATTVEQIQQVTQVAVQINAATAQWKLAQETANQTVTTAGQIADRITAEAKDFSEFMAKANDAEKAHLRLEVEKLRRGETEWLQVLVRIFDHVYAIYQAGFRSGKPGLGEQLGHFQNACRDIVRRIGLVAFEAKPGEPFNPQLHNLLDAEAKPGPAAAVAETIATGFTYQGQLVRPALVSLQPAPAADPPAADSPAAPPPTDPPPTGSAS